MGRARGGARARARARTRARARARARAKTRARARARLKAWGCSRAGRPGRPTLTLALTTQACRQWSGEGQCATNPAFMLSNCSHACGHVETRGLRRRPAGSPEASFSVRARLRLPQASLGLDQSASWAALASQVGCCLVIGVRPLQVGLHRPRRALRCMGQVGPLRDQSVRDAQGVPPLSLRLRLRLSLRRHLSLSLSLSLRLRLRLSLSLSLTSRNPCSSSSIATSLATSLPTCSGVWVGVGVGV